VLVPVLKSDRFEEALPVIPVLHRWVRIALVAVIVCLLAVFTVAVALNPYRDGKVWLDGTHRQLGLPPCQFKTLTGGIPCPSCGMTSSFALLVHGDVMNSLRANAVGTVLAVFCLALIPWAVLCAARGRLYLVNSIEWTLTRLVVIFVVLMLVRWGIVLAFTL
jgi:hypothetical protein